MSFKKLLVSESFKYLLPVFSSLILLLSSCGGGGGGSASSGGGGNGYSQNAIGTVRGTVISEDSTTAAVSEALSMRESGLTVTQAEPVTECTVSVMDIEKGVSYTGESTCNEYGEYELVNVPINTCLKVVVQTPDDATMCTIAMVTCEDENNPATCVARSNVRPLTTLGCQELANFIETEGLVCGSTFDPEEAMQLMVQSFEEAYEDFGWRRTLTAQDLSDQLYDDLPTAVKCPIDSLMAQLLFSQASSLPISTIKKMMARLLYCVGFGIWLPPAECVFGNECNGQGGFNGPNDICTAAVNYVPNEWDEWRRQEKEFIEFLCDEQGTQIDPETSQYYNKKFWLEEMEYHDPDGNIIGSNTIATKPRQEKDRNNPVDNENRVFYTFPGLGTHIFTDMSNIIKSDKRYSVNDLFQIMYFQVDTNDARWWTGPGVMVFWNIDHPFKFQPMMHNYMFTPGIDALGNEGFSRYYWHWDDDAGYGYLVFEGEPRPLTLEEIFPDLVGEQYVSSDAFETRVLDERVHLDYNPTGSRYEWVIYDSSRFQNQDAAPVRVNITYDEQTAMVSSAEEDPQGEFWLGFTEGTHEQGNVAFIRTSDGRRLHSHVTGREIRASMQEDDIFPAGFWEAHSESGSHIFMGPPVTVKNPYYTPSNPDDILNPKEIEWGVVYNGFDSNAEPIQVGLVWGTADENGDRTLSYVYLDMDSGTHYLVDSGKLWSENKVQLLDIDTGYIEKTTGNQTGNENLEIELASIKSSNSANADTIPSSTYMDSYTWVYDGRALNPLYDAELDPFCDDANDNNECDEGEATFAWRPFLNDPDDPWSTSPEYYKWCDTGEIFNWDSMPEGRFIDHGKTPAENGLCRTKFIARQNGYTFGPKKTGQFLVQQALAHTGLFNNTVINPDEKRFNFIQGFLFIYLYLSQLRTYEAVYEDGGLEIVESLAARLNIVSPTNDPVQTILCGFYTLGQGDILPDIEIPYCPCRQQEIVSTYGCDPCGPSEWGEEGRMSPAGVKYCTDEQHGQMWCDGHPDECGPNEPEEPQED